MPRRDPGPPECHPDRPYHAKGMCAQCYRRAYHAANAERVNAARRKRPEDYAENYRKPPVKPSQAPTCHPDREHVARGLCGACYQKAKFDGTFTATMATCHPERGEQGDGLCRPCYQKRLYWQNPEKYRQIQRDRGLAERRRLREEMVTAYGGMCACANCPESNPAFLTLDHINGDGQAHRKLVGSHVYRDLRRRGWPTDGYRLLCWNCNAMTRFGRTCPHEETP